MKRDISETLVIYVTDSMSYVGIPKISFNPNAKADETLCFKHYNASEIIMGRSMESWLRFSVCFWHSFRGLGTCTI
jgi:xylose isomerase